jgi:cytochrome c2
MKYGLVVAGLAVVMAIAASSAAPNAAGAVPAGDPVKGLKIYTDQKCSMCHNVGATTPKKMGPELTAVGTKRDAAWLAKYLPNPKGADPKNKMVPVKVKGQDLDDLIAYLLTLKGK